MIWRGNRLGAENCHNPQHCSMEFGRGNLGWVAAFDKFSVTAHVRPPLLAAVLLMGLPHIILPL